MVKKISNPTEYRLALLANAGLTGEINAGFLNAKSSETYYRNISVVDFLSNSEQQQEPEKFFPIEITSYISPEIGSLPDRDQHHLLVLKQVTKF